MAAVAMMKLGPLALGPRMTLATNIKAEKQVPITRYDTISFNRRNFGDEFIFGAAGASYQYEGAVKEGGRGPSIWDTFTHKYPERITDHSNADVTIDQYHLYKEDVKLMKDMGLDSYRFSISWSRLLPNGKLSGGVRKEGVDYYNNLIDELLRHGITPFVTIFHWDLPQALEDEYGGFLSPKIIKDYEEYAELCFKLFGDRVKHWVTFNEPSMFSQQGYASGTMAPGRGSTWENAACTAGDSGTEPYLVTHHILLAHAATVHLYRDKYKESQKGRIGITLVSHWFLPISADREHPNNAASRALDFMLGWFMEPLTRGKYPDSMRDLVGPRLPEFKPEQSELLIKSYDFIGLNYYTTYYAADAPQPNPLYGSYLTDSRAKTLSALNGIPIGPQAGSKWLYVYPKGIYDLLLHIKINYQDPIIYITENGISEKNDPTLTLEQALQDVDRIDYHYHHLKYVREAMNNKVKVEGYYVWSLFDNFEWNTGYTVRFGMNFVDYDNLQRHPKLSSYWFKSFLRKPKKEHPFPLPIPLTIETGARKDLVETGII